MKRIILFVFKIYIEEKRLSIKHIYYDYLSG